MFPIASLALVFDILAKDNASGTFRNVGNAADRAGKQTSTFGTSLAGAMKLAGAALIGGGLIQGFKSLYEAAAESQKIGRLTEAVIKSTGGAAGVSAKQVSDLAASIAAKTGVDDEAIQSGQNLLLTFTNVKNAVGKGNDIFNQATQAVTDMSVALGKDAPSSAVMLGKALNDPIKGITALSKAGVSFTAQQKDQIRTLVESGDVMGAQKIILSELGKEFGGAAEAAATPLDKLKVRAGNLAEQVGGYLVPAVDRFATFADAKLMPILEDAGTLLNGTLVPAFKALAAGVGVVADAWNSLPGPVQAGVVAMAAFAALKGPVSAAFETIALRALYMKDSITAAGTGMGGFKAAGSGLVGFLGGPWGLAIGAATVGLGFLVSWLNKSDGATEAAKSATQDYAAALRESEGAITANVRAAAAKAAEDAGLLRVADRVGVSLADVTEAITTQGGALDSVRGQLKAYIEANTLVSQSENGPVTMMTDQAEAAQRALDSLNLLAGQNGRTAASQERLTEAVGGANGAANIFTESIKAAEAEVSEAKQAVDNFKLSLDILSGATVSMLQVETAFGDALRKAEGAMEGLDGSVLNADGTLNAYSESGSRAADVLLDVRNSGNDLIATMIQQGASATDVAKRDADLRASFIRTANQMGITGGNADRLADQILGIPGSRQTTISADTGQATGAIGAVQRALDGLRDKRVTVTTVGVHVGTRFGGGTISERAVGGPVAANTPYLVGERGPELIFPSQSGFVATAQQTRDLLRRPAESRAQSAGHSVPVVHVERWESGGQSPYEQAEALAWLARTRG